MNSTLPLITALLLAPLAALHAAKTGTQPYLLVNIAADELVECLPLNTPITKVQSAQELAEAYLDILVVTSTWTPVDFDIPVDRWRERLGPAAGQVIVLERERRALGFLVDGVIGVEPIDPPERPGDGLPVKGLSSLRGAPVAILDPDALAAAAERLFRGRAG